MIKRKISLRISGSGREIREKGGMNCINYVYVKKTHPKREIGEMECGALVGQG